MKKPSYLSLSLKISVFLILSISCARFKTPEESSTPKRASMPKNLQEAVTDSTFRTTANIKRDIYRHPVETLNFFGVKPEMKIIEITPGNGWYMEILAPLLSAKGQYIMAAPVANNSESQVNALVAWSKKFPEVASKMTVTIFDPSNPKVKLAPANSVDMILTFRNVHNWMAKKNAHSAFKSFFKALKKGGTLGVVEHRAPENRKDPLAKTGYVRESDMIKMAKKAGFRLVAKSEINANAKDTKDYADGVWTLPPTLKLKEKDREKYLAIGESDRMTLKFIKP
jgi:predicted methyltransferase